MPEAESMQELMFNCSQPITVATNGKLLLPHMPVANRGEASVEEEIWMYKSLNTQISSLQGSTHKLRDY